MTTTKKSVPQFLDECSDCGPAEDPETDGPRLTKKGTTPAQATHVCPKCKLPRVTNLAISKKKGGR